MAVIHQEYKAADIAGISKKIGTELEQLPMETHQAIVSIVAQMFQHRGFVEQKRVEQEKLEREEARDAQTRRQTQLMEEHAERARNQAAAAAVVGVTTK